MLKNLDERIENLIQERAQHIGRATQIDGALIELESIKNEQTKEES